MGGTEAEAGSILLLGAETGQERERGQSSAEPSSFDPPSYPQGTDRVTSWSGMFRTLSETINKTVRFFLPLILHSSFLLHKRRQELLL